MIIIDNKLMYKEILELREKVNRLECLVNRKIPIQMYRIKLNEYKTTVVCDHCHENGEVNIHCNKCGGKGIHHKTKQRWGICKKLLTIDKIDRDENGDIRYWEDMSDFYNEASKLLHFNEKSAKDECEKRNNNL